MIPDTFTEYLSDVFHCERCHRVVRTYDAVDGADRDAILEAHAALCCRPTTTTLGGMVR